MALVSSAPLSCRFVSLKSLPIAPIVALVLLKPAGWASSKSIARCRRGVHAYEMSTVATHARRAFNRTLEVEEEVECVCAWPPTEGKH